MIIDALATTGAEAKTQAPFFGDFSGGCGTSGRDDQQRQEIIKADAGAGEGVDERALKAMLKQFQKNRRVRNNNRLVKSNRRPLRHFNWCMRSSDRRLLS